MTQSHPHTSVTTDIPRGIETNGIGKVTTGHLNLTTTIRPTVYPSYYPNRFAPKHGKAKP